MQLEFFNRPRLALDQLDGCLCDPSPSLIFLFDHVQASTWVTPEAVTAIATAVASPAQGPALQDAEGPRPLVAGPAPLHLAAVTKRPGAILSKKL